MPKNPRTFKLPPRGKKLMRGEDIRTWQREVKSMFKHIGINCPIAIDGIYAQQTRGFTASLCEAYGLLTKTAMKDGVTPEFRVKMRNKDFTSAEKKRMDSKARKDYRASLRDRWRVRKVHSPVSKIITDDWGYHPGVHDGIDVQSDLNAAVFAMVRSRVIDVRSGGWWGKAPSGEVSKGDGIVQLEVLESVGPFKKGQHIGYGHVEHARVRKGEIVRAGEVIALVGKAVTPHIHLMVNHGNTNRGIGTMNPRAHLNYSIKHG